MTTLDTRPTTEPTVIDGVYSDARDVPARNPHRTSAVASALILLGAVGGAAFNFDGTDLERGGSAFALTVAFALWLTYQIRFHARAEAGDR